MYLLKHHQCYVSFDSFSLQKVAMGRGWKCSLKKLTQFNCSHCLPICCSFCMGVLGEGKWSILLGQQGQCSLPCYTAQAVSFHIYIFE